MPKLEKKEIVVNEIRTKIDNAKSIILVKSRGLTVEQDTILRKELREAGVEYKVYKNTMINFAIKDTKFQDLDKYLTGPTAIAISYEDATVAASIINKKMEAMPNLEFKAGIIDEVLYDANGVKTIADIPSRDVLISRLLGSFKSPMASFARVINAIAEKEA